MGRVVAGRHLTRLPVEAGVAAASGFDPQLAVIRQHRLGRAVSYGIKIAEVRILSPSPAMTTTGEGDSLPLMKASRPLQK